MDHVTLSFFLVDYTASLWHSYSHTIHNSRKLDKICSEAYTDLTHVSSLEFCMLSVATSLIVLESRPLFVVGGPLTHHSHLSYLKELVILGLEPLYMEPNTKLHKVWRHLESWRQSIGKHTPLPTSKTLYGCKITENWWTWKAFSFQGPLLFFADYQLFDSFSTSRRELQVLWPDCNVFWVQGYQDKFVTDYKAWLRPRYFTSLTFVIRSGCPASRIILCYRKILSGFVCIVCSSYINVQNCHLCQRTWLKAILCSTLQLPKLQFINADWPRLLEVSIGCWLKQGVMKLSSRSLEDSWHTLLRCVWVDALRSRINWQ